MDFTYTADEEAFRTELRTWLEANLPTDWAPPGESDVNDPEYGKRLLAWQRTVGDGGWAGLSWPKEYGGGGMTMVEQLIFLEEQRRSGAPFPFVTVSTVG